MEEEIWKDIPGYEGEYQVSNMGQVRGLDRTVVEVSGKARPHKGRVLKLGLNCGYWVVGLKHNCKRKLRKVHHLVMLAFVGPRPPEMQVNHKNGIKADERLENLEYVTRSENMRHAIDVLHTHWSPFKERRGEQVNTAKLTREQVTEIRHLLSEGMRPGHIAARFGVRTKAIYRIRIGQSWGWLP